MGLVLKLVCLSGILIIILIRSWKKNNELSAKLKEAETKIRQLEKSYQEDKTVMVEPNKDQYTPPEHVLKLENDYHRAIYDITTLVRTEYPTATWEFSQLNVGRAMMLNTSLTIKVFTANGCTEKREVLLKNGMILGFEEKIEDIKKESKMKTYIPVEDFYTRTQESDNNHAVIPEEVASADEMENDVEDDEDREKEELHEDISQSEKPFLSDYDDDFLFLDETKYPKKKKKKKEKKQNRHSRVNEMEIQEAIEESISLSNEEEADKWYSENYEYLEKLRLGATVKEDGTMPLLHIANDRLPPDTGVIDILCDKFALEWGASIVNMNDNGLEIAFAE